MKNLNTYIIEKLKINKETKLNTDFKEGDPISCFSLYFPNRKSENTLQLEFYKPFELKKLEKDSLTYLVTTNNKEIRRDCFVNEHGYYQVDEQEYSKSIYIKPAKIIDILNTLIKEKVFNPKYYNQQNIIDLLKDEYFDLGNWDLTDVKFKYYDKATYVNAFERPKDIKDFIATYYAEY